MKHIKAAAKAGHAAKVRAMGGSVKGHSDVKEDKALIHHMVKPSALKAAGGAVGVPMPGKSAHRAHKGKSGKTNVNILVAPHGGSEGAAGQGPGVPPAPVPAPPPPMRTPPMPMTGAGGLPGIAPGAMPGMPPRKRGGKV